MTFTETVANGTPFNNPSAQPALVEMWRSAINKARQEIPPPPVLPTTISINMDGVGEPLVVNQAGLIKVTFPCRILACDIFAGTAGDTDGLMPAAVTATVDLRLGTQGAWSGGSTTLYGTGAIPTITASAEANLSVTGWHIDLQPFDLILWRLATFSGAATWMAVELAVRRLDTTGIGESGFFDSASIDFTDSSGNPFVVRG
jgi:hypothetical protein